MSSTETDYLHIVTQDKISARRRDLGDAGLRRVRRAVLALAGHPRSGGEAQRVADVLLRLGTHEPALHVRRLR